MVFAAFRICFPSQSLFPDAKNDQTLTKSESGCRGGGGQVSGSGSGLLNRRFIETLWKYGAAQTIVKNESQKILSNVKDSSYLSFLGLLIHTKRVLYQLFSTSLPLFSTR